MKKTKSGSKASNNLGAVIGLLALGAAVGAAAAMLTTPQNGKKLRQKISGKSSNFTESLKSKFNSLLREAKSEYETEKANAKMHSNAAKENAKEFVESKKG